MDKISKLSQAIRLGATFRPQCNGSYFDSGRSCALGAAYEAITGINNNPTDGVVGRELSRRFGISELDLGFIARENDSGTTRERIADLLEKKGL